MLSYIGGAIDPLVPTIFQVANVDISEIKVVHGEEVPETQCSYELEVQKRIGSHDGPPLSNFLPTVEN